MNGVGLNVGADEFESSTDDRATATDKPKIVLKRSIHTSDRVIAADRVGGRFTTRIRSDSIAPLHDYFVVLTNPDFKTVIVANDNIYSLPGEPYKLLKPIPVKLEQFGEHEFVATFQESNIAVSGESPREVFQDLIGHILDMFEILIGEESTLGPEPTRQLRVLKKHLAPQP